MFSPDGKTLASYALHIGPEVRILDIGQARDLALAHGGRPGIRRSSRLRILGCNEFQPRGKIVGGRRQGGHQPLGPRDT